MITRRTTLTLGLAASAACACGLTACSPAASGHTNLGSIDALLIDSDLNLKGTLAALVALNHEKHPAQSIKLDAGSQPELIRLLGSSQTLIGLSTGATLFCMEHMARDHGFRLTARFQQEASEDRLILEMAELMRGTIPASTAVTQRLRAYRPSRTDNLMHVWVLQKSSPSLRLPAREV